MLGAALAWVGAAMAGNATDGVAVGAITAGGQLAGGFAGAAAGVAIGTSICARQGGFECMAPLLAIPIGGLGLVVGAPIGAGIGAAALHRDPWRTVGFVAATEGAGLALAATGILLASSADDPTTASLGAGMAVGGAVVGLALPAVAAGVGAGTDRMSVTVLPRISKDTKGVQIAATF
jgi:hypothetical protein